MNSIYEIIKKMEEKDTDGHALYLGKCKKCGATRVGRLHDLNKCTDCQSWNLWCAAIVGLFFSHNSFLYI